MAEAEPLVLSQQTRGVRTLTLNRPLALNSFTAALHGALRAALDAAAGDESVRCVVFTGAGRGFCAGQDLAEAAGAQDGSNLELGNVLEKHYRPLIRTMNQFPTPLVAAVNGVAAGAGVSFALACDVVIAARSASFLQAFAKIGLIPDAGGTWLLPRLVGRGRALRLAMLAEKLPAPEAERMGLIWRCVDDDALAAEAQATAERLAALPTAALVATRQAMDAADRMSLDEATANETRVQSALGTAHDCREGVAAFLAKRAPVFKDRG